MPVLALALAPVASCGGDSTDRAVVAEPSTTMATTTATPEDEPSEEEDDLEGVEPLPLVATHPAPPPLPPAGCRFRNVEGELGAVVQGIDFRVSFRPAQGRFRQGTPEIKKINGFSAALSGLRQRALCNVHLRGVRHGYWEGRHDT